MTKQSTVTQELICPQCYNIFSIRRQESNQRKLYHLKDIYCPMCKKVTHHVEVKNKDILERELEFKPVRTKEEEQAYQLIKKANARRNNVSR